MVVALLASVLVTPIVTSIPLMYLQHAAATIRQRSVQTALSLPIAWLTPVSLLPVQLFLLQHVVQTTAVDATLVSL